MADTKNTEAELKTFLQSSIESYKDVLIFSIDTHYRYLFFNSAFKSATNYAYGTVISEGMSMLESITSESDRLKAKANCDRALAGESHMTLEVYGDINKSYYETKYNPILDYTGNTIGVTVLSANVTERKVAEEQIISLNKELESFSYSVAHDLRAPLRAVNGYAEILEEDYNEKLDEEGKRLIEVIKHNALRMGMLIDDLLQFAKMGRKEIQKTEIEMNALVSSVINEIGVSSHKATITTGDLHKAKADKSLLQQVMMNLISNALKYSSNSENPLVEIASRETDNEIIFAVKDNGVGFDMQYADKLFGVFQRLHSQEEFKGTGVGLAIVHRVISKHGGKVWAEGKVNEGACFSFSLPKSP